ncbi:MAG: MerR family transcriptional regulator [Capsulimonadales bacterium]|nr:MerR family transcriptional regulator [Capsulimonadales bacterium]
MKIQDAARRTGLSVPTIRYYEEIGLILPVSRESGGHRVYTEDDLYLLAFVARLRSMGMPIARIRRYTALVRQAQDGADTVRERLEILVEHEEAIEGQIAALCEHLALIRKKIAHYRERHPETKPSGAE